jgi:cytochrome P450
MTVEFTVAPVFMPGPRPDPILGWRGALMPFAADPVGYLTKIWRDYGNVAAISRSEPVLVFAFGPEYNRQIFPNAELFHTNPLGTFSVTDETAMSRISNGLLSMNGAHHRQQRRLMMPAFHRRQVDGYRDRMVAAVEQVIDTWRPGEQRDMAEEMQRLTMGVALKTLFSLEPSPEASRLAALFKESLDISFSPLDQVIRIDLPGTGYYRLMRLAEQIETAVQSLVDQRKASGSEQQDVLSTLIATHDEDGQRLSDAELIGQTYTLFVAGHETSSNALCWTLFLLDQHREVLADLRDELAGVLQGAAPTVEQLGTLPLLDAVVKESLRLMPPASLLLRRSTAPFTLSCYELPENTAVFLSPYITHRMPEVFDNPLRFDPARWQDIEPSLYEYLPFGAGPRMCIGTTFALMEIKIALAMLVQRFQLTIPPGAQVDQELRLTLRPRNGLPMNIHASGQARERSPVHGNIHEAIALP